MKPVATRFERKLRVAVVGAGVMGKYHAAVYASLPQAELVALVDPDPVNRGEAAATFGCLAFPDVDSMLSHIEIDAASVAAPTAMHYGLSRCLLEAGVHVLVEKPVATDVKQAQSLMELSKRSGLILQVGHITRFYRAVHELSTEVRNPYLIEARRLTPSARIKDVGVILDLMIHDIDIILRIVKGPVQSVSVAGHMLNGSPFEDVAAAQIIFESGCIARLLASRVAPDQERSLVISEPQQTVRLDFAREPQTEVTVYRMQSANGQATQVDRRTVQEDNPLRMELEHFLARIGRSAQPIGTLEDDVRSLELATRLLAAMELRRPALA
ncbi:MAG: Gfo/Idh/MocA family oxidoreductase [Trueperaceae bacterium]